MKANGVVFARVLDLHFRVIVHFYEAFVLMLRNTIFSKWVILLHISVPYITLEFDIVHFQRVCKSCKWGICMLALGYKSFKSLYCYMCGYLYTQFILTKYKYMLLKKKQVSTFYKLKKKNLK